MSPPPLKTKRKARKRVKQRKNATPKKTRKQEYAKKHDPKVLNPKGLTDLLILEGLEKKTIVTGPPPPEKKTTSKQWEMGMKFLFEVDEEGKRTEIENWYYCDI